jgi:hypothetical protein
MAIVYHFGKEKHHRQLPSPEKEAETDRIRMWPNVGIPGIED